MPDASAPLSRAAALALGLGVLALLWVLVGWIGNPAGDGVLTPRDPGFRIDVNQADAATLQLLPGLGPSIAQNVVRHRQIHGPFREPADLEAVRLIGPVLRERIEPWITLDSTRAGRSLGTDGDATTPAAPADGGGSPR